MYPDWLLSKALNTDPRYALYVFLSQVVPCYWWLQLHLKCSMHDPVLRLRGVDMHCFCLQCPSLQEAHVHILDDGILFHVTLVRPCLWRCMQSDSHATATITELSHM